MKKTIIALVPVLMLGVGFAPQANAGDCMQAAHSVCDWAFPGDTTVATEIQYTNCMLAAAAICNADEGAQLNGPQLKAAARRMSPPDAKTMKQFERPGWQNPAKKQVQ